MEKELYFLRHAIAFDPEDWNRSDEERPLTEEGRKKMTEAARGMKAMGVEFEALWSSPLVRAYQTAEIVKARLPFSGKIEMKEQLRPGASLDALLKNIKQAKETRILLVGHEPILSHWIQQLLGCGGGGTILLKKGALCRMQVDVSRNPPEALLLDLLQAKALRLMG